MASHHSRPQSWRARSRHDPDSRSLPTRPNCVGLSLPLCCRAHFVDAAHLFGFARLALTHGLSIFRRLSPASARFIFCSIGCHQIGGSWSPRIGRVHAVISSTVGLILRAYFLLARGGAAATTSILALRRLPNQDRPIVLAEIAAIAVPQCTPARVER